MYIKNTNIKSTLKIQVLKYIKNIKNTNIKV